MAVELLAPAGSYEGMRQAIDAGADAVYAGGAAFGARAYAKNFTEEELLQAIDDVHVRNKKLYLTVNTLVKNRELQGKLYEYLAPYYERGLDAVIVQDLGVISFIRREFPGLPIHASTQMTVTGPMGAQLLKEQGIARVVTARELSLEELSGIYEATGMEIETFIHGALCYSYSGQCLFSSILGGRSGNRGRCAQPCRLPYQVKKEKKLLTQGKEVCPLSPKDMCTIDILPQILESGVASLKIEGRMKQPSYTAGVVNIYRKYLDRCMEGGKSYEVEAADRRELLALFNRGGFSRGYYEVRNGRNMMSFANEKKVGDSSRDIIKFKEKVKGNLILSSGKSAILELFYGNHRILARGDEVQTAKNRPMDEDRIREQMEKTGNTPYEWESLSIEITGSIFLPVKSLNQLRRDAFGQLEASLLEEHRRSLSGESKYVQQFHKNRTVPDPVFTASCRTSEQCRILLEEPEVQVIYCPSQCIEECLAMKRDSRQELYLAFPHILRMEDLKQFREMIPKWMDQGLKGFLVRNLEAWGLVKEMSLEHMAVLDSSLYTWSNEAKSLASAIGMYRDTAPLELNEGELKGRDNRDSEMVIYGYLPLMVSAQCIQKNLDGCRKNNDILALKDRYSKEFSAECCCDFCYNIIYNSVPYGLLKERDRIKALGFSHLRLSFTLESSREMKGILRDFIGYYKGKSVPGEYSFTKGHYKRGVE